MKKVIICFLCLLVLVGCATHRVKYIYPELPAYEVEIPKRPTLEKVEGVVPVEVNRNTVKLIAYIEKLETVIAGYQSYYKELTKIWSDSNVKD